MAKIVRIRVKTDSWPVLVILIFVAIVDRRNYCKRRLYKPGTWGVGCDSKTLGNCFFIFSNKRFGFLSIFVHNASVKIKSSTMILYNERSIEIIDSLTEAVFQFLRLPSFRKMKMLMWFVFNSWRKNHWTRRPKR